MNNIDWHDPLPNSKNISADVFLSHFSDNVSF